MLWGTETCLGLCPESSHRTQAPDFQHEHRENDALPSVEVMTLQTNMLALERQVGQIASDPQAEIHRRTLISFCSQELDRFPTGSKAKDI